MTVPPIQKPQPWPAPQQPPDPKVVQGHHVLQISEAVEILEKAADAFDRVGSPGSKSLGDLVKLGGCYRRLLEHAK